MSGISSPTSSPRPPPAARDSHDGLEGLERLICQKHDDLQLLMKELLLQQSKVLDARLEEVAAKMATEKQKEPQIVPATCVSSQMGPGHSMHANTATLPGNATDSDNMLPKTSSKPDCGHAELLQDSVPEGHKSGIPSNTKALNDVSARMKQRLIPGDLKLVQKENDASHWLIHHHIFGAVIHICILANALQFGLQVDLDFGQWNTCWTVLDNVFTAVFALEMILSIYCLRLKYFNNRWHLLDFFVAWSSMIDIWLLHFAFGNSDGHVILRFFRFLRLLRMLKVLRMRRDLHLLVTGIADSTSAMLWVAVLLSLIIYTNAILFVEVVGDPSFAPQYLEKEFDNLAYFGTLLRAMHTLFNIAILDTWSEIVRPVSDVQPFMVPVFLIFLVMTSFALLNALIGIIVDRTTAATRGQQELEDVTKRQGKEKSVRELIQLVAQIDENSDTVIKTQEMEDVMHYPAFKQIVEGIELPAGFSGTDLLTMLDGDGSGTLSVEEFLNGMFQLIYSNQFQSQCLTKLSVGKIQQSVFQLHQEVLDQRDLISRQIYATQRMKLSV